LVLILLFGGISSFGISAVSTIGWSMIPDTVEFGQWKTGKRTEGIIYSVYSFSQKLATAISGGIVALILDKTSYVNGGVQSTLTLNGIKATITIIPVAFLILSSLIIWFYKLDKSTFNSIKKEISNETNE
jgi:Na+/melibiose symporter-like transporter